MKMLLNKLQKYQRAKYISRESINIMVSIFICQFLNIAFVPFIALLRINYEGTEYIPSKTLTSWMPYLNQVVKTDADYFCSDFNKKWYVDTGGKYFGFFILQIFIPQCFLIFAPWAWARILKRLKYRFLTPLT